LEKQLSGWEQELKRTEGLAEQARKDMVNAPTREAWESAKTFLETYEANIVDMQQRIVDLRARIEAKKKEQGAPAPKPAEKPAAPAPSQL
jgi:predicted  nucleic acid-binding Zn-ribbon protein